MSDKTPHHPDRNRIEAYVAQARDNLLSLAELVEDDQQWRLLPVMLQAAVDLAREDLDALAAALADVYGPTPPAPRLPLLPADVLFGPSSPQRDAVFTELEVWGSGAAPHVFRAEDWTLRGDQH